MENRSQDRRSRLTRQMIRAALVELMRGSALHEISVKRLCEAADVNRSTFYRYYGTTYDVYKELLDEVSAEIFRLAGDCPEGPHRLRRQLTAIFSYIEQNRPLFLVLMSENGALSLGETFTKLVDRMADFGDRSELALYSTQFISAGATSIVWIWLSREDRLSPAALAGLLSAILLHGVKKAMAFAGEGETAAGGR